MEKAIYTRPKCLVDTPMSYCPGCGHGIIQRLLAELIDEFDLRDRAVGVGPVGCSVTIYNYLDIDFIEASHGRATAVATGISRSLPDTFVFSYQGDGDLAAIGTAEAIHAASRGEKFVSIFVNNTTYAMTGGQMAPTTLPDQKTATSPTGRDVATMGYPLRVCEMINTLPAPALIARTMISDVAEIRKTKAVLRKAFQCQLQNKGFSLVEVLSPCPTHMRMSAKAAMEHVKKDISDYFPVQIFREPKDLQK